MTTANSGNIVSHLDTRIEEAKKRIVQAQESKKRAEALRASVEEKKVEHDEIMQRVNQLHIIIGQLIALGDKAEDFKKDKLAAVQAATELKKEMDMMEKEIIRLATGRTSASVASVKAKHVEGFSNTARIVSGK